MKTIKQMEIIKSNGLNGFFPLMEKIKRFLLYQDDVYKQLFDSEIQFIKNFNEGIYNSFNTGRNASERLNAMVEKCQLILNIKIEDIIKESLIFIKNEKILTRRNNKKQPEINLCINPNKEYNRIYFKCDIVIKYKMNYVILFVVCEINNRILKFGLNEYSLLECLFLENNNRLFMLVNGTDLFKQRVIIQSKMSDLINSINSPNSINSQNPKRDYIFYKIDSGFHYIDDKVADYSKEYCDIFFNLLKKERKEENDKRRVETETEIK